MEMEGVIAMDDDKRSESEFTSSMEYSGSDRFEESGPEAEDLEDTQHVEDKNPNLMETPTNPLDEPSTQETPVLR
jgi:hypothetical protein